MCTVVYLPTAIGCILSSNRDEQINRPKALPPTIYELNDVNVLCPIDPKGGGTWIGCNSNKTIIILLNGGLTNHQFLGNYARSRGLIVKELLASKQNVIEEWNQLDLLHIEPFTLIVFCDNHLYQLVWDGIIKQQIEHNKLTPHIFSSATLYDAATTAKRKELFTNWIAETKPHTKENLFNFLMSYKEKNNGFIMNRDDKLKTLSISFIEFENNKLQFSYNELDTNTTNLIELSTF